MKEKQKVLQEMKEKLTEINNVLFYLRTKERRTGLTKEQSYRKRVLQVRANRLKQNIENLEKHLTN